jgi:hypothetical protein
MTIGRMTARGQPSVPHPHPPTRTAWPATSLPACRYGQHPRLPPSLPHHPRIHMRACGRAADTGAPPPQTPSLTPTHPRANAGTRDPPARSASTATRSNTGTPSRVNHPLPSCFRPCVTLNPYDYRKCARASPHFHHPSSLLITSVPSASTTLAESPPPPA